MQKFNKNINNSYESETCSSSGKSSNDSLDYEQRISLNQPKTSCRIIGELLNPNLTPQKYEQQEDSLTKQQNFQCQFPPRKHKCSSTESDFDGFSDDMENNKIPCRINLDRINKSPELMAKLKVMGMSSGESDDFAGFTNENIKTILLTKNQRNNLATIKNITPTSTEISSSSSSNCSDNDEQLLINDTPDSISVAPTENTPNSSFASSGEVQFGSSEISDQDERCQKDIIKMAPHLNHLRNNTITKSTTLLLSTEDTHFSIESNSSTNLNNNSSRTIEAQSSSAVLLNIGDENSSNAVDHTINTNINDNFSTIQRHADKPTTSFDGIIQTITKKPNLSASPIAVTTKTLNIPENKTEINLKLKLLEKENRFMELINERSPDLFDVSADESDNNEETTENDDDQSSRSLLNNINTQDLDTDATVASTVASKSQQLILETEKTILNRIQLSMSGVLPPPSVTILQYNVLEMLSLYRSHYDQFNYTTNKSTDTLPTVTSTTTTTTPAATAIKTTTPVATTTKTPITQNNKEEIKIVRKNPEDESLFKPTHTINETSKMNWPDCMNVKCHGVHYNHSIYSENIEFLCMKYAERNIGAETMSTFSITSPSSGKKRMMRLKMLAKSPGNRLSHLAKRRAIFSSENLLKSNGTSTESSKLGKNQLVIDTRKYDKRGRLIKTVKAKTPKRRTPGRKTPGSARKSQQQQQQLPQQQQQRQLLTMKLGLTSTQSTRETSKRALFQSPPKEKPKPQFSRDVASRVEKSKRVLFSSSSVGDSFMNSPPPSVNGNNNFQMPLKRKREEYFESGCGGSGGSLGNINNTPFLMGNPSKIPRIGFGNMENLTPRSLKLSKSQSFSIKSTLARNNTTEFSSNDKLLFIKANSEQSLGMSSSQQLSNLHKQKILWAVAESLKRKNIASGHVNFKQYASCLAKVVKRFYLELSESTRQSFSTSATMLKIAEKHVILVLKGKTEDEIYLNEKYKQENSIDPTMMKKLTGYIAPEQYEKYQLSLLQRSTSNLFSADNSMDSFSQNYHSQISQSSESFSSQSRDAGSSNGGGIVSNDVEASKRIDPPSSFVSLVTGGGGGGGSGSIVSGPSGAIIGSTGKRLSTFVYSSNSNSSSKTTAEQTLNRSSSKNNSANVVLRENVDCDQRQKSGQKYYNNNNTGGFSGKDQKNVSPYTEKTLRLSQSKQQLAKGLISSSGPNTTNTSINANILKAKRQISFDA